MAETSMWLMFMRVKGPLVAKCAGKDFQKMANCNTISKRFMKEIGYMPAIFVTKPTKKMVVSPNIWQAVIRMKDPTYAANAEMILHFKKCWKNTAKSTKINLKSKHWFFICLRELLTLGSIQHLNSRRLRFIAPIKIRVETVGPFMSSPINFN